MSKNESVQNEPGQLDVQAAKITHSFLSSRLPTESGSVAVAVCAALVDARLSDSTHKIIVSCVANYDAAPLAFNEITPVLGKCGATARKWRLGFYQCALGAKQNTQARTTLTCTPPRSHNVRYYKYACVCLAGSSSSSRGGCVFVCAELICNGNIKELICAAALALNNNRAL
jgi:hypothetical protein